MEAVLRYKVYQIERGLLVEPEEEYREHVFSDYETMDEALDAIAGKGGKYVVLPSVFTRCKWTDE